MCCVGESARSSTTKSQIPLPQPDMMASRKLTGGTMKPPLPEILRLYDDQSPLEEAHTIPASWYVDERVAQLERQFVFGGTWQVVGRVEQLREPGSFVTADVVGEPIVVVRAADGKLGAFYNVCRHHAAAVVTERAGAASGGVLRCPYHGWSYGLDGALKGAPEFEGVCKFDRG